jgi:hypothetical protein
MAKKQKMSLNVKFFILIIAVIGALILFSGMPQTAQFFMPTRMQGIPNPLVQPPTQPGPVIFQPDLVPEMRIYQTSGSQYTLYVGVKNIGSANLENFAQINLEVYVQDKVYEDQTIILSAALKPGETVWSDSLYQFGNTGNHGRFGIRIESVESSGGTMITESNEDNNEL